MSWRGVAVGGGPKGWPRFPAVAGAALALLALGLGRAEASPATDLYRKVTGVVQESYYGWSPKNFGALRQHYAGVLAERCAAKPDTCDYATGRAVITELLNEFGDGHTYLRDPESAARYREIDRELEVPRTGLRLARVEGGLLVLSVAQGSPADAAGLRRFDLLTEVGGQAAGKRDGQDAPVGPNEFASLERRGEPFAVTRRRAGETDLTLVLRGTRLTASDRPEVVWAGAGGRVAAVQIATFLPRNTAELFLREVRALQEAGIESLIVDLRFNGGGNLHQCIAAASVFGPVVYNAVYKDNLWVQSYAGLLGQEGRYIDAVFAPSSQRVWKGKVAVLVGPDTASCAEVFSYYARRHGALTVGAATKGVGNSGVNMVDLPDGSLLAVTVLRAYASGDEALPARITPEVTQPLDVRQLTTQGRDSGLEAALRALGYPTEASEYRPQSPPN